MPHPSGFCRATILPNPANADGHIGLRKAQCGAVQELAIDLVVQKDTKVLGGYTEGQQQLHAECGSSCRLRFEPPARAEGHRWRGR